MKEFSVSGMTCAACSARVEKAAKAVEGVTECAVSLLTDSMRVEGDFDEKKLFVAVEKAGYGISVKGKTEKTEKAEKKEKLLPSLLFSLVLLVFLMYVSMGHMLSLPLPDFFNVMARGIWQMLLSLWILLIHKRFFVSGIRSLFHRAPNMDTLVSLGSGVSFLYSLVLLFRMTGADEAAREEMYHGLFFESAAMILVLITVGKFLEERSKGKTTSAIRSLQKLSPDSARLIREGETVSVPLKDVKVNDHLLVLPGDSVPVDGVILEGEGALDESALTGESLPVDKAAGDRVWTGTSNLSGKIVIRAEKVGRDTVLSRIVDRVTALSATKAPISRLADRVSGIFVPVVMTLSLCTLLIWLLLGETVAVALTRAIAVLVVSCPCALGLATPVAVMVSSGVAARHGVLFKTAAALEEAGKTKVVILDKTGTVTEGNMRVTRVVPAPGTEEGELLSVARSLEEGSLHPIAQAVKEYARAREARLFEVLSFRAVAGCGVQGEIDGKTILGGKAEYVEQEAPIPKEARDEAASLAGEGCTLLFFAKDHAYLGMMALSDTLKSDSAAGVSELQKMGVQVAMITGDREESAKYAAKQTGIETVLAGVLPEGKEKAVAAWKEKGSVMMVGDGVNDALALTAADVGVAIGAGVDVAMDAAEVVLMKSTILDVPRLIRLSRKTLRNIKENLFWAFCYNLVGIPLAAGVFSVWGWRLTPMFAAAAMSFSSILVVSNALRLNFFPWGEQKKNQNKKEKKEMEKILKIEGMMCAHCEAHVKKALEAIPGVKEAFPSHEKKEARVVLSAPVKDEDLKAAVEQEGYRVL